jgi:tryptophan-rich sensory protein
MFFFIIAYVYRMKLILSLLLTLAVGSLAGLATSGETGSDWYINLQKPSYQPPGWLFAPVWTTLYIMMGIAFYLVWKQPVSKDRNISIGIFIAQLAFNFLWSFIFFKWHLTDAAFAEIVVLWILIFVTIFRFAKHSKAAAWLLIPYIAWVSFAFILTFDIMRLN